ncbi:hypothetical protein DF3PA_70115 [Candidatus Defluviicoccus seviourii]|uniref:NrS-1 polymerase-like helicase domain-containing protein n=1 Tax=Candidatus Defluviicoccus seviourii TaxID=2565273 RepID=A0A564WJH5_9PROT|nr:hypothetical protein DF3PA_70115 [Candidatus Defluviicoccus seviourii]
MAKKKQPSEKDILAHVLVAEEGLLGAALQDLSDYCKEWGIDPNNMLEKIEKIHPDVAEEHEDLLVDLLEWWNKKSAPPPAPPSNCIVIPSYRDDNDVLHVLFTTDFIREAIVKVHIEPRLRKLLFDGGTLTLCRLGEEKVLEDSLVVANQIKAVVRNVLARELPPKCIETEIMSWDPKDLNTIYEVWDSYVPYIEPSNFSVWRRKHDDNYCMYRCPIEPDDTIEFPKTQEFLDRLTDGPAFAAFIYGVWSGLYAGRQVMWIWGPQGEEGKSFFTTEVLSELFGLDKGLKAISNNLATAGGRFGMGAVGDAVMVLYPDANNTMITHSEFLKTLAGGGRDAVSKEKKFANPVTSIVKARVIVTSNFTPHVTRENFITSRIFIQKIKPFVGPKDPSIGKVYRQELPGFLAHGKRCYDELCANHEEIKKNKAADKLLEQVISACNPEWEDFVSRVFEFTAEGVVTIPRMKEILEEHNLRNDYKALTGFLASNYGIRAHQRMVEGERPYGFWGLKERDQAGFSSSSKGLGDYD